LEGGVNLDYILNKKFELFSDNNMKIYYAPHNEIINTNAKIFIVGITPGWTQTSIAYKTAHDGLIKSLDFEKIKKECKKNSRFAGSMRKNLIEMLDELKLNRKLHIDSCLELFEEKAEILHTTSMIPYPVFIKGKNYTGFGPKILDNEILKSYLEKYFYKEMKELPNVFIIPLFISFYIILIIKISFYIFIKYKSCTCQEIKNSLCKVYPIHKTIAKICNICPEVCQKYKCKVNCNYIIAIWYTLIQQHKNNSCN